ncbi:MAG: endolytic transglycosylase MltG [Chitinophagaceae bacterium]|nr:MAG: endolytic transglycosylase MltG [Chitinophagaceae bacterium]
MKKIILVIVVLLLIVGIYLGWQVFGPTVKAPADNYFYIKTGATYNDVITSLKDQKIIGSPFVFNRLSRQAGYDDKVRPGRYEIKEGMSLYNLIRMLKSGRQSPVKLVINKLRTKEDLAKKMGNQFEGGEAQAIQFLYSNDSLNKYGLDTNTAMTAVIPNTYLLNWNNSFSKLFGRLKTEEEKFWNKERKAKAASKNMSTKQVYTMASIVEEETNKLKDKGLIASVYMNRIKKGMKLEADPTVKYAMRDFGLKRILYGHLKYPSPFNTYQNTGLPPGPICTPSTETIDAVLDAPSTDYIFFVAKPGLDGYSNFASSYEEHLKFAKAYQVWLDDFLKKKQAQQSAN